MKKQVKLTCRKNDPDWCSGVFDVEAEYLWYWKNKTMRELRLADGRIIEIKPKRNGYKCIVFDTDLRKSRNHKITDIEFLYDPTFLDPQHNKRRRILVDNNRNFCDTEY